MLKQSGTIGLGRRAVLGGAAAAVAIAAGRPVFSQGLTKVTFGTDWLAQAEHGGFYQALATGLYAKAGFTETGRRKDYYTKPDGTREDALLLSVALSAADG